MKITVKQELLLKALQLVVGVSDKKNHLPILGNVLIIAEKERISLICSDTELELMALINQCEVEEIGEVTVSCRKLLDICRSLPEDAPINLFTEGVRVLIRSGRTRFTLTSLPAADFPVVQLSQQGAAYTVSQKALREMIERTHFAMAQQDVRYYLNGMLFVFNQSVSLVVATDGHRLAMTQDPGEASSQSQRQVIVPRKAINELLKPSVDAVDLSVVVEENHIKFIYPTFSLTSKLIEGRFPDYTKVIPLAAHNAALIDKDQLKQAVMRASILSNEKHKGVRFLFAPNQLMIQANNPEQEEAEEELTIDYPGDAFEIGFNAHYVLDVLNVLPGQHVRLAFSDPKNSVLLSAESPTSASASQYVIMPLRL